MRTIEQDRDFVTAFLADLVGSAESPTLLHFGWFHYDGGELGLNICTGDQCASVSLDFPFEPELYALGATDSGAQETYENSIDMRHFDPSDFWRHAEELKEFLADAEHVARSAQRALAERPDDMF